MEKEIIQCAYTKLVPLSDIHLDPDNSNTHTPEQIDELVEQFKFQGIRHPIIISLRNGLVAAGEGRYLAAKKMGLEAFPCDYQHFDTEEQQFAFGVADNAIQGWSKLDLSKVHKLLPNLQPFDISRLAIPDFKFEPNPEEKDPDATPEVPKEAKTKRGELWILGQHRLLIDDCTVKESVERLMNGEKAEFCFTSPPYSDQRDYKGDLELSPKHLAKFLSSPCKLFAVNLGMKRESGEIVSYWDEYILTAKSNGHKFLSWNVWDKQECGSIGSQTAMFGIRHEWIFVFGEKKDLNRTIPNKHAGDYADHSSTRSKDGSLKKNPDRVVFSHRQLETVTALFPLKARNHGIDHPAMFPTELPEIYINACCSIGDIVFEPFTGSGSTLIACEKTKRKCYGMEIEPLYGDVILTRWATFTGKDPVREDGTHWSSLK